MCALRAPHCNPSDGRRARRPERDVARCLRIASRKPAHTYRAHVSAHIRLASLTYRTRASRLALVSTRPRERAGSRLSVPGPSPAHIGPRAASARMPSRRVSERTYPVRGPRPAHPGVRVREQARSTSERGSRASRVLCTGLGSTRVGPRARVGAGLGHGPRSPGSTARSARYVPTGLGLGGPGLSRCNLVLCRDRSRVTDAEVEIGGVTPQNLSPRARGRNRE
jgi:hypothetical protein